MSALTNSALSGAFVAAAAPVGYRHSLPALAGQWRRPAAAPTAPRPRRAATPSAPVHATAAQPNGASSAPSPSAAAAYVKARALLRESTSPAEASQGLALTAGLPPAEASDVYTAALRHAHPPARAAGALGLGRVLPVPGGAPGRAATVAALTAALATDADAEVRAAAASALGALGGGPEVADRGVPALVRAAGEEAPDGEVLPAVVAALCRLAPPSAVAALGRLAVQGEGKAGASVAIAAIEALRAVGDDRGIPPLLAAAAAEGGGDPAVRVAAVRAAAALGASPAAPRGTAASTAVALDRLAANAGAPAAVRDAAAAAGSEVAAAAAAAPSPPDGIDDPAYTALVAALGGTTSPPGTRTLAAVRLRGYPSALLAEALAASHALGDTSEQVRSAAAALAARAGLIGDLLTTLSADGDASVRAAAADALLDVPREPLVAAAEAVVEGLARALKDDGSWLVRSAAAISLGGLPQAVAGDGGGDGGNSEVPDGAAGLAALGAPAAAAMVDALLAATAVGGVSGVRRGEEEGVRRQAVTALGFLGVPEAVPAFERLVASHEGGGATKMMRYRIAGALRGVHTPRALALARELAMDRVGYVASMAANTVAELEKRGVTTREP
ncbi:hypothetical protein MMPV_006120 [Pyropia vietnamensis]